MEKINYLVVGAGLTGSVIARELAQTGKRILVIDKRHHTAGNMYDEERMGALLKGYGPHIIHTNKEHLWKYFGRFATMRRTTHIVKADVSKKDREPHYINVPFNVADEMGKDTAMELIKYFDKTSAGIGELLNAKDHQIQAIGEFIFDLVFVNYTAKQWGMEPKDVDPEVLKRVPVNFLSGDNSYFKDEYQGVPYEGYTYLINNILDHENISVKLRTDFNTLLELGKTRIHLKNVDNYDLSDAIIIYTGPSDGIDLLKNELYTLPYRSLEFKVQTINFDENVLVSPTVNYPNKHEYTRVTECKQYYKDSPNISHIIYEYPRKYRPGFNEPMYPINNDESNMQHDNNELVIVNKFAHPIHFAGRLGTFRYLNMDVCLEQALELAQKLIEAQN